MSAERRPTSSGEVLRELESAIPPHLASARTRHRRVPDDYVPRTQAFVARHDPAVTRIAIAHFGLQYRGQPSQQARAGLQWLTEALADGGSPHWEWASYVDEADYTNRLLISYWDDVDGFDDWFSRLGTHWTSESRSGPDEGCFTEVVRPSSDRYETLFTSDDRPEGIAATAGAMSGAVREHAYWGSARDRIPRSQTDELAPSGAPTVMVDGPRRRVIPGANLCLIRSGQDWTDTDPAERALYEANIEPALRTAMDFLRDSGLAHGCYSNRFMTVIGEDGRHASKTFGMSWWKSLAHLERWAGTHPTHLAVFSALMTHLSGPGAGLRRYHEITVASAAEQFFEYFNCHDDTGLLRAREN